MALSADGKKLVGGPVIANPGRDKVFVWDVKTGEVVDTLDADGMSYFEAAISDDGKWIAGAGFVFKEENGIKVQDKGKVFVWEAQTGKVKHEWTDGAITANVAFSPDGKLLAAGGPNKTKMLASVGYKDARVSLWDLTKDNARVLLEGHVANVLCVAFSPDGRTLASGGDDGTLRFWRLAGQGGLRKP
jgi:WD40 repeat protein